MSERIAKALVILLFLFVHLAIVEELEKEKDEWKDTAQAYFVTNQELREQNKRYRATINAMQQILKDAIHSLDVGEKVQGLEYGVQMANEALEVREYEGYKGI